MDSGYHFEKTPGEECQLRSVEPGQVVVFEGRHFSSVREPALAEGGVRKTLDSWLVEVP